MSDLPPDPFWDSDTETWDSDTDTWDALPVEEPPAPEEPPPTDPGDPGDTGTEAQLLRRTLPEAPPVGVYRFLVGDLLTGSITEELPFTRASYSFLRNRPGGFSGSIAKPNSKVTRGVLDPGRSTLFVERDGVILWGGIIWTVDSDRTDVRVAGEGFWSHFRRIYHYGRVDPGDRTKRKLVRYNDVEQFEIVRSLISYAQGKRDLNIGVIVDDLVSRTVRDEVFRPHEPRNIAEAIEDMAEANNGFDFALEADWEGDAVVKRLRLFSSRGRRTDIVFDIHKNCTIRSRQIDATETARFVYVAGSGQGPAKVTVPVTSVPTVRTAERFVRAEDGSLVPLSFYAHLPPVRAEDGSLVPATFYMEHVVQYPEPANYPSPTPTPDDPPTATALDSRWRGLFPAYEATVTFPDVSSRTVLESRARKLASRRSMPMETISIEVTPQRDLPLGAWRVGDYVRVRADDDFETVDDFYRVVGWQVDVDEAGQEVVTLDFGPIPA